MTRTVLGSGLGQKVILKGHKIIGSNLVVLESNCSLIPFGWRNRIPLVWIAYFLNSWFWLCYTVCADLNVRNKYELETEDTCKLKQNCPKQYIPLLHLMNSDILFLFQLIKSWLWSIAVISQLIKLVVSWSFKKYASKQKFLWVCMFEGKGHEVMFSYQWC